MCGTVVGLIYPAKGHEIHTQHCWGTNQPTRICCFILLGWLIKIMKAVMRSTGLTYLIMLAFGRPRQENCLEFETS
jgi:predicted membrane channel-forming protein YqfA (hemolysin III family)